MRMRYRVTYPRTGVRGHGGADTISISRTVRGSAYNDTLTGDSNDNVLEGGAGGDTLDGGGGNDDREL